jgi:hypothetical protein
MKEQYSRPVRRHRHADSSSTTSRRATMRRSSSCLWMATTIAAAAAISTGRVGVGAFCPPHSPLSHRPSRRQASRQLRKPLVVKTRRVRDLSSSTQLQSAAAAESSTAAAATSVVYHLAQFNPVQTVGAILAAGTLKFTSHWRTYCWIPIIAALVGWFTNWLAVKMSKLSIY